MQYLQEKSITLYEFYKKSGVTRGVLTQNNGITEDNLVRFLTYAPDVNPDWLLTGRGSMLVSGTNPIRPEDVLTDPARGVGYTPPTFPSEAAPPAADGEQALVATPATTPSEGIPLIPLEAMAGIARGEQTVLDYECERYVVPAFRGADFLITVSGDSMVPKYSNGDIVACRRVPMSGLFFQWNKPYVIDTTQGPLVKRIKPGSDPSRILLISENPQYDPFELSLSDVRAVALVIGIIRQE